MAFTASLAAALLPSTVDAQITLSANWVQSPTQGPADRAGASIAYDSVRGVSYLFGGSTSTSADLNGDTWKYDGATWTQLQVSGPSPRYLAPMVFDSARGVSVLFGGYSNGVQGDTWELDGSAWTRRLTPTSPPLRLWTAMAYDSVRHVTVLFGGAFDTGPFNDTWQYDGSNWSQVVTVHSPAARRGMGLAFDPVRDRMVLFGGQDAAGVDLNDTWEFDGTDWTQVTTTAAPSPRLWHSMAYDPVLGGTVLFGGAADQNVPQSDTWLYDGTSWQQMASQNGPNPRFWAAAAYDSGHSSLVMFGGGTTPSAVGGQVYGDTWALQGLAKLPLDWGQAAPAASPSPRAFSQMDYDSARGVSVLFSGSADGGPGTVADTWEWNGSSWTQMTPAASPPAVAAGAMAYDSARGVSVLFGGDGAAGLSSSTWEWDGTTWTQRNPAVSPSARSWPAMAYDATHGNMVMFGGDAADGATWLYDRGNWRKAVPANSPSPRMGAAMAFDPTRGRIVLFGGRDASGERLADTWEWDGSNWTQIVTASAPYPRFWATLAFDAQSGRTVLFGGDHIQPFALGEENDTWEWNGSQWTRNWTAAAPPVRAGHAMAYDSKRDRMVIFGGMNGATSPVTFYGDTWVLGAGIATPAGGPGAVLSVDGQGPNFGNVTVGSTSANPAVLELTSTGSGPLTIYSIRTTGDFTIAGTDCPTAGNLLASGSYCLTLVNFAPTAPGALMGTVRVSDNAPNGGFAVQLQGSGVQIETALTVTPAVALFDSSATFGATLTANGSPLANQAITFHLPTGLSATFQTNAQGTATWAGASLSGLHVGIYSPGIDATFAGTSTYLASSATAAVTVTQPVTTSYSGSFVVADNTAPRVAITVDQRTPASDSQFLDYTSTNVWARFTVSGSGSSTDFYAQVGDAPDWTTSGLGVAAFTLPPIADGAYTVTATLVGASGSTTLSTSIAGDDARVGLASSPTKGGYLSGGGAIAADPSANTSDTHGYFSVQLKPGSSPTGNLAYVYRVSMDVGGGDTRDVDVWVTSTDSPSLSGSGSSATASGHFSVEYVDARTGQRYSNFEFSGGTYKLSVTNATNKSPAGFALLLKRPDGTVFHVTGPVNPGGNVQLKPVVLGSLINNL